ncbi:MAG: TlpA disulfide reductase family protein [Rothia sp. (in: high G+C Gram-positive bacteria)]|uniref:TlpA family protein disulfide reductase n=1 Tax=Rothia sp. (in: high G+C Gram-positive bacteria) TaxID=1885016 RepID=UPI00270194D3|nr:TlpA disulfide reductase family protein [Rothia sp. (in: high G+C Gram-positive bacteria)]
MSTSFPTRVSRKQALSIAALGTVGLLSACSSSQDSLAAQADAGDSKGYIAGDGSVTEYAAGERGEPVEFESELFDGTVVSAADLRGKPVLLNFWYAGCAPCRAEAPWLNELHASFGEKVAFYGANVRDEKGTAEAFEKNFEVPYPSFRDVTGKVLLAMSKYVPAQAVPTTVVLDAEGRVAARILGQIDKSVLNTLLEDQVSA